MTDIPKVVEIGSPARMTEITQMYLKEPRCYAIKIEHIQKNNTFRM